MSIATATRENAGIETDLEQAQADMRHAYFGGGAGMIASALAWFAAAIVAYRGAQQNAVWTLILGGMLIHPAAMALSRLLGRPGTHRKGNVLARLAGASTVWLVASIPLAYAASRLHVAWFFPAMLLVIGGRYLTFETLYGLRAYLLCGSALLAAGLGLGYGMAPPFVSALAGAAIETGFALAIIAGERRSHHRAPAPA